MGRIKTKLVKSKTEEFIQKYPEEYTEDFDENKLKLAKLLVIRSKKIRNAMAGYLVRKAKALAQE